MNLIDRNYQKIQENSTLFTLNSDSVSLKHNYMCFICSVYLAHLYSIPLHSLWPVSTCTSGSSLEVRVAQWPSSASASITADKGNQQMKLTVWLVYFANFAHCALFSVGLFISYLGTHRHNTGANARVLVSALEHRLARIASRLAVCLVVSGHRNLQCLSKRFLIMLNLKYNSSWVWFVWIYISLCTPRWSST